MPGFLFVNLCEKLQYLPRDLQWSCKDDGRAGIDGGVIFLGLGLGSSGRKEVLDVISKPAYSVKPHLIYLIYLI